MRNLIVIAAVVAMIAIVRHDYLAHSCPESHWLVMFGLWLVCMVGHKTNKASR